MNTHNMPPHLHIHTHRHYSCMCVRSQVPDGDFILYLYQTEQLSEVVADSIISTSFRIEDVETVPDRSEDVSDFFYGVSAKHVCMSSCAYVSGRVHGARKYESFTHTHTHTYICFVYDVYAQSLHM
jgi:hypothetical protein